ncbi:MAG TPA: hypothetical protein VK090_00050, partial [Paracoccaceae bacterium]|nr:hypothetical protein [Paracoccaceae bacterium]
PVNRASEEISRIADMQAENRERICAVIDRDRIAGLLLIAGCPDGDPARPILPEILALRRQLIFGL